MPTINIDTLTVPSPVKQKLRDLSISISFDKQSSKGANGWLFFGTNRLHQQRVAVKFYDWGGDPAYHAEPRYLASLNADNVVTIMDAAFVDAKYAYFVTPFFERGDLDDELSRGIHANLRAVNFIRDVLSGLSHLHAGRLLHRDLKPQNILVSDDDRALIGDFGSVKRIPDGQLAVPGSGHSLIFRPPESVVTDMYGVTGDLYQVGLVLYQLLGGALPYEETAWLNFCQLKKYRAISDSIDRQVFASAIIKERIKHGRIINLESLPPWVCPQLRRTISKTCNADPQRRYQSCSEFLARIASIRADIHDWRIDEGYPTHHNRMTYRIVNNATTGECLVQKRGTGQWRNDNSFPGSSLEDLVAEIEERNR
jgi:eukaryotic-like serine/threonine-protein kinase